MVGWKQSQPTIFCKMNFDEQLKQLNYDRILAIRRESEIRETALLPMRFDLVNVEVNQFTPLHYILLDFANNPHISGEKVPTLDDTLQFLWVVSPEYKHKDGKAFSDFKEKYKDIDHPKMVEEIQEYLNYALLDLNVNNDATLKKNNKAPTYAWIVPYIDLVSSQYGWTDDYILSLPFARILQYCRCIESRLAAGSGTNLSQPNKLSDIVTTEILDLLNNKAKAENKVLKV